MGGIERNWTGNLPCRTTLTLSPPLPPSGLSSAILTLLLPRYVPSCPFRWCIPLALFFVPPSSTSSLSLCRLPSGSFTLPFWRTIPARFPTFNQFLWQNSIPRRQHGAHAHEDSSIFRICHYILLSADPLDTRKIIWYSLYEDESSQRW